jgi:hypothetical protein
MKGELPLGRAKVKMAGEEEKQPQDCGYLKTSNGTA